MGLHCPGGIIVALGRREKLHGFPGRPALETPPGAPGRAAVGCPVDARAAHGHHGPLARRLCPERGNRRCGGAPMPLLGLPRFRVVLEHYAG
jgi:hypothetical protein